MQRAKPANTWQHRMRTSARSAEGRGSSWAAVAAQPPSICAAWACSMLQRALGTVLCAEMCDATPVRPPLAVTCAQAAPKTFLLYDQLDCSSTSYEGILFMQREKVDRRCRIGIY